MNADRRLFGIKFWAIHSADSKFNYQVLRYMGEQNGMHFFQNLRGKSTVGFSLEQIEHYNIKPFCLNSEYLNPIKLKAVS